MTDFRIQHSWAGRARAAGCFLLFVVLSAILFVVLAGGVGFVVRKTVGPVSAFYVRATVNETCALIPLLLATLIMAKVEKRKFGDFGMGRRGGVRACVVGFCFGAIALSLLLISLKACGVFSFGSRLEFGRSAFLFAGVQLLFFSVLAVAEEVGFRGYALVSLSRAVGFWPALIGLSALFAAAHLPNSGESRLGILSTFVFGLLYGYTFRRTGALWFTIGLHLGWDYFQSFVFGVPNSGVVYPGRLMNPTLTGPTWLNGGAAGPEASVLIVIVFIILIAVARFSLHRPAQAD